MLGRGTDEGPSDWGCKQRKNYHMGKWCLHNGVILVRVWAGWLIPGQDVGWLVSVSVLSCKVV